MLGRRTWSRRSSQTTPAPSLGPSLPVRGPRPHSLSSHTSRRTRLRVAPERAGQLPTLASARRRRAPPARRSRRAAAEDVREGGRGVHRHRRRREHHRGALGGEGVEARAAAGRGREGAAGGRRARQRRVRLGIEWRALLLFTACVSKRSVRVRPALLGVAAHGCTSAPRISSLEQV